MEITRIPTTYDRAALKPRILHIGFGAFARAHQFVYLEELLARQGGDWGVVAVRLNSGAEALSALDAADRRYTVLEADDSTLIAREIGVICATCHPLRDGRDALLDLFARPEMSIVALTITEKGYCLAEGVLDMAHKGIQADLANPQAPATAIGVIVEGLARRRAAGLGGLSVLSCDNLPENGALARAAVIAFARQRDAALAGWIEAEVRFPATMVDRIVPALDADGAKLLTEVTGTEDPNGMVCEPFRQWVIEDDFANGRPAWEEVGAQLVQDVVPYEEMKLRMLNGAHSFLANLGALAGHETVAACMEDPLFCKAARALMLQEQATTLAPLEGVDLATYAEALLARFANSRLNHKTTQIATDTSAKLPQRLLAPAQQHLERGTPWTLTALGIAGWLAYVKTACDGSSTLPLADPLAERLREIATRSEDSAYVTEMLALREVFPAELVAQESFTRSLRDAYAEIRSNGVRAAIEARL